MQLYTRSWAGLPRASPEALEPLRADRRAGGSHAAAESSLPALRGLEITVEPTGGEAPRDAARIVAWNAERGGRPDAAAALLAPLSADAFLLSELDVGMARSGQRHTARELARRLGCGSAFAVEFVELGLGSAREREEHAGKRNDVGYHGGALLSPHTLARPCLARLDAGGDWWDTRRGEPRVGGRIAVLATLPVAGAPVTLASVHLESHAGPEQRDAQTAALLEAIEAYAPGQPVLLGGDFNTHGLGLAALEDSAALARALRDDPTRLANPLPHEPLFERLRSEGFDFEACNRTDTSTQRTRAGRGSLHLDWFFARGLDTSAPEVVAAVDPRSQEPLSDHEAIAVTIAPRP